MNSQSADNQASESEPSSPSPQEQYVPSRQERLRPVEYIGGAAAAAIFVGVIVLAATHNWLYTLIAVGAVFIVTLVVLALLQMTLKTELPTDRNLGEGQEATNPDEGATNRFISQRETGEGGDATNH